MKNSITIEDIGQLFADNGYIISSFGMAHYNTDKESFDYISNVEVMEIFRRIYPNFERRELSIKMIEPYLPVISEGDFYVYEKCQEVTNSNYSEDSYKKKVEKFLQMNDDRKKQVPGKFPGDDFKSCIQFLTNNNVFTNWQSLYQYQDGDFKPFGIYEIRPLMKDHLTTTMQNKDYYKILAIAKFSLTDIDELTADIDIRNLINILTRENWKTYEKIVDIQVKTMKTQGVKENEYPLCME